MNLHAPFRLVNTAFIAQCALVVNNSCMDTPIDRVKRKLDEKRWSWAKFARELDTTDQRVYNWRKRGLPSEEVLRVSTVLGVSTDWLLMGTSSPTQSPRGAQNVRPAPPDTRRIPVISYIHAGHPAEAVDAYVLGDGFSEIAVDADLARMLGPYAFALTVEGNSMAPEYQPGDIVVIDPDTPIRPGDVVVAKLDCNETATLKKYRDRGQAADGSRIIELVPLNDDYPTLVMDAANPGHLVGPVIEHRRRRRR